MQPNILMIMADQFRLTTLDGMGDDITTPNIRRIMDQGMVFDQACCTSPLWQISCTGPGGRWNHLMIPCRNF